jgi:hypothetical protein
MPPRKPPKSLMSTCMDVISNSFLDITVNIEQTGGNIEENIQEEVAKYIFSSLPSTLISLLLSQTMKEFATRWRSVIDISENKLNIPNTNGIG